MTDLRNFLNHTQINRAKTVQSFVNPPEQKYDQRAVTEESILNRISIIASHGDHVGQRVLAIGDADLTALSLAAIGSQEETVVADIDKRLADVYFDVAMELDLEARYVYHDMRIKTIEILRNQFSVVITEPMRTLEGVQVFLSRAAQCVITEGRVYVNYSEEIMQDVKAIAEQIGFIIEKNHQNVVEYQDGGHGGLLVLHATSELHPIIEKHYLGPLYEREVKMNPKPYECQCQAIIPVGNNEKYKTLEELYTKGCPQCGSKEVFVFHSEIPRE